MPAWFNGGLIIHGKAAKPVATTAAVYLPYMVMRGVCDVRPSSIRSRGRALRTATIWGLALGVYEC